MSSLVCIVLDPSTLFRSQRDGGALPVLPCCLMTAGLFLHLLSSLYAADIEALTGGELGLGATVAWCLMVFASLVVLVLFVLFWLLFVGGMHYMLGLIFLGSATPGALLPILAWSSFPIALRSLLFAILTLHSGDVVAGSWHLGPLHLVDPFMLWHTFLTGLGLSVAFDARYGKAQPVAAVPSLLGLVIQAFL